MKFNLVRKISVLLLIILSITSCDFLAKLNPDEPAHFEGGTAGMKQWISTHVEYPIEAVELGIEGKVFLQFIVTKKGKVEHVVIRRGADPLLDKEALRVIKQMPNWNPARKNGKPIDSEFNLPISFKLE